MRPEGLIRRLSIAGVTAGAVVALDLVTKRWASAAFTGGPEPVIPGVLWFTYTENPGSAFSLFQNGGPFLGVAAIVAVGIIIGAVWNERPLLEVVAFGMIAGGAVGNLVDRIFRGDGFLDGKVIDWIRFPNFPVFNVADSAVTIGVALLFVAAWRARE